MLADGEELLERELRAAISDADERGWPIGVAFASTISASGCTSAAASWASRARRCAPFSDPRAIHGATPLDPFVTAFEAWLRADAGRPRGRPIP